MPNKNRTNITPAYRALVAKAAAAHWAAAAAHWAAAAAPDDDDKATAAWEATEEACRLSGRDVGEDQLPHEGAAVWHEQQAAQVR